MSRATEYSVTGTEPVRAPRLNLVDFLDRQFHWMAVWPTIIIMLLVFGLPLAFSFYLSFQGWTATRSLFGGGFVGLENYELLLTEPADAGLLASMEAYFSAHGPQVGAGRTAI